MVSLSLMLLTLAIIFAGLYLIFKMNKTESLRKVPHSPRRHHPKP